MVKYLLDTSIAIHAIKHRPPDLRGLFEAHSGQMAVSSVTAMELLSGAEMSANPEHNLAIVEGLLARLEVLSFDQHAAVQTAQLRAELAEAGSLLGPYDTMIAGQARSLGLILVSSNTESFSSVPGLRLQDWANPQHRSDNVSELAKHLGITDDEFEQMAVDLEADTGSSGDMTYSYYFTVPEGTPEEILEKTGWEVGQLVSDIPVWVVDGDED